MSDSTANREAQIEALLKANPELNAGEIMQGIKAMHEFQELMKNPSVRRAALRELAKSGDLRSNKTYYTDKFAKELKPIVDAMIVDGQDREFPYQAYRGHYVPNTLYQKVCSSMKYLIEFLDEDEKYKTFRESVEIKRGETGVLIEYIKDTGVPVVANIVVPKQEQAAWKTKLYEFMENSKPGQRITLSELKLTQEEVEEVELMFHGADHFMHVVTQDQIKIAHLRAEDAQTEDN